MTMFERLFMFSYRIGRKEFLVKGVLPLVFAYIVWGVLMAVVRETTIAPTAFIILGLPLLWSWMALLVKRLHDRNRSGWWLATLLVPYLGWLWVAVHVLFLRGSVGDNRFGPDPCEASDEADSHDGRPGQYRIFSTGQYMVALAIALCILNAAHPMAMDLGTRKITPKGVFLSHAFSDYQLRQYLDAVTGPWLALAAVVFIWGLLRYKDRSAHDVNNVSEE